MIFRFRTTISTFNGMYTLLSPVLTFLHRLVRSDGLVSGTLGEFRVFDVFQ